ncbi:MAG: VanW family protein [Anaerolineales bacterium]
MQPMTTISYPYPNRAPVFAQIMASIIGGLTLFLGLAIAWTLGLQLVYAGRIFPGVSVAGVDVSGLTPADASVKLSQTLSYPYSGKIVLRDGEKIWVVTPAQMGMTFDPSSSAQAAYRSGRSGGLFSSLDKQLQARSDGLDVAPVIVFDQRVAHQFLQNLALEINQPVQEASLQVSGTDIIARPGQVGRMLDVDGTLAFLSAQMQTFRDGEVPLVITEQLPQIMDVSAQAEVAKRVLSEPLKIYIPNAGPNDPAPWVVDVPVLANMLIVHRVENGAGAEFQVALDPEQLRETLVTISTQVDRGAENARFIFNDETRQLDLLTNATIGRVVDVQASIIAINDALLRGEHSVPLQIVEDLPAVTDDATAEQLGVTELVSAHTTYFYGSSAERIQNIATAASRFHGLLIPPGETFSMGDALGDVSLDNGFAEALIIYGGRTIKGVGGGVCQVSTTLFRTVFFGGYPVVERYSHAYRVSYYEQTASGAIDKSLAGMDATVYFPLVDFKFTNDTPYWILMETYMSSSSLTWKFYSTSDGRSVTYEASGPLNVVPAPPPMFEENEELKKNQIKQVDWAANGADVVVTRTVWRNGQIYFSDQFNTHYEPWQAVCQYGPGTENPEKRAKDKNLCRPPNS